MTHTELERGEKVNISHKDIVTHTSKPARPYSGSPVQTTPWANIGVKVPGGHAHILNQVTRGGSWFGLIKLLSRIYFNIKPVRVISLKLPVVFSISYTDKRIQR